MNRQYFIEKCFSKNGKINKNAIDRLSDEEIKYLMNLFDYVESINEALFRIKHNIEVRPVCKVCGNKTFFNGCIRRPYSDCCSQKCADIYRQQKIKQNSLEKYGVDHPAKTQENIDKHIRYYKEHNVKEKLKDAVKRKYGVDNVFQLESVKDKSAKSCLERYGVDNAAKSEMIKEKMKNTCIKKYGVDVAFKADSVKEKIKKTCIEKYNVDNIAKSDIIKEKTKETDFRKYGCYHIISNEIKEKSKQTLLKHYGVDSPCKSKEIQEKIIQNNIIKFGTKYHQWSDLKRFENNSLTYREYMSMIMSSDEIRNKIYVTHKKNNSFHISKTEYQTYILLKQKYPCTISQYRSEIYPFNCDFYIPEIDTYIECNYHWTHGGRPYIGSDEDKRIVEKWKAKNTKYYNIAINVWTIRDVKKRETARQNNLNWIEFFSILELKNWLNKIK